MGKASQNARVERPESRAERLTGKLLARYRSGECTEVWNEIRALGAEIQSEPLRIDALNVTAETMRRACANIAAIVSRLEALRYELAASAPLQLTSPTSIALVNDLDSKLGGALPLSLRRASVILIPLLI